jgi:hypothetical protein
MPSDVSVMLAAMRNDILVVDGGTVKVLGTVDFHFNVYSLPGKSNARWGGILNSKKKKKWCVHTHTSRVGEVEEVLWEKHAFWLSKTIMIFPTC